MRDYDPGSFVATEEMKKPQPATAKRPSGISFRLKTCTLMTAEVRKTCTELKEKIAAPPTAMA